MSEEMTRTIVSVSKRTLKRLKQVAADRNISMAAIMREALDEKAEKVQPMPKSGGVVDSGRTDLSQLASDIRVEPRSWR